MMYIDRQVFHGAPTILRWLIGVLLRNQWIREKNNNVSVPELNTRIAGADSVDICVDYLKIIVIILYLLVNLHSYGKMHHFIAG